VTFRNFQTGCNFILCEFYWNAAVVYPHCTTRFEAFEHHTVAVFSLGGTKREEILKQKVNDCVQHIILQKFTNLYAIRSWSFQNICDEIGLPHFCATLYSILKKNTHRQLHKTARMHSLAVKYTKQWAVICITCTTRMGPDPLWDQQCICPFCHPDCWKYIDLSMDWWTYLEVL